MVKRAAIAGVGLGACAALFASACDAILGIADQVDVAGDAASSLDASRGDDGATSEGGSPCAQAHTFCDDFDEIDASSDLASKWGGGVKEGAGGALTVADAPVVSPPHSLGVRINALDGGAAVESVDDVVPAASFSKVHCEWDLQVDHVDPDPDLGITVMRASVFGAGGDPLSNSQLYMTLDANADLDLRGGAFYADGGVAAPVAPLGPVPLGAWMHVSLEVSEPQAGSNAQASVTFANGSASNGSFVLDVPKTPTSVGLGLGQPVPALSSTRGWQYYVDNFACDVTP